ncbi:hypothetical protein [Nocardia sp. CDC160]|uniref:hypothetical protein n=1 Tax=Nocardia sp. CDC160 TaxID=3112166 RepID=UPI002DB61418|nr:hypothetical protein [Nocardia sp. CDC160]MEC3920202.1 hypothetical protein [Nocardia sp. CDC160]
MNDSPAITIADVVQWLHDDGLARLAGIASARSNPLVAYTVEVQTGTVTAFPVSASDAGSNALTLAVDDLPEPADTPRRLVAVGVTTAESVLVVDLAVANTVAINGDQPQSSARAWALQLLLNPEITLTTNCAYLAIAGQPRLRHTFIPGGRTIVTVDDSRPPITSIILNHSENLTDHLDLGVDGTAEMYLGSRFWKLRSVLRMHDETWTELVAGMTVTRHPEHVMEGD